MVYGVERTPETVKLARMNLAVNNLRGEIKPANSYYEDPYNSYGRFDYVMANPPFNVDDVNLDRVKSQQRFNEYGIPQNKTKATGKKKDNPNTVPNANYLWINLFATSLKPKGRAALVMANSASDARNSEADIRKKLIQSGVIDCMLTLPKNMFYTVTLPATLWFFDKSKQGAEPTVLFIDARNIFRQVTRALREFTEEHIQNIAAIVRLYRGERERFAALLNNYKSKAKEYEQQAAEVWPAVEIAEEKCAAAEKQWNKLRTAVEKDKSLQTELNKVTRQLNGHCKERDEAKKAYKVLTDRQHYFEGHAQWLQERFPNGTYEDVTGLCKAATLKEIEEQDWSLNPGRYVGVVIEEDGLTEEEFLKEMKERHEALNSLNKKGTQLEQTIQKNLLELWN
jgi:type I restriction enzyme M protein